MFQGPDLLLYLLFPQVEERRAEVQRHQNETERPPAPRPDGPWRSAPPGPGRPL
jgi:hypothetical protein